MNLLFANHDCLQSHLERTALSVQTKLAVYQHQSIQAASWFAALKAREEGAEFERHGTTAVVQAVGVLGYKFDLWSWFFDASNYLGIANRIRAASADESIDRIVLYVDSPGGNTHGLMETADAIYAARQSKPVVAVVDPTAASAGYWLASQASEVVGIASGWVGSVGAQWEYISIDEMLKKAGVDVQIIRSEVSPMKNSAHPYEPVKPEAKKEWQELVNLWGNRFVSQVARGRGVSEERVKSHFGQGRMIFNEQAVELGMIDRISSMREELSSKRQSGEKKMKAAMVADPISSRSIPGLI